MNDDIVTRLRQAGECPTPLRAYLARAVVLQAADEIERLRRNTGCARNQGTTQFCAEALDAQRELDSARQTVFQLRTKLAACCRTPSPETTLGDGETFIPEAL